MSLSISIIGVGGIAAVHVKAIRGMNELLLVSICDNNEQRLCQQTKEFGCHGYANYHDLLATSPDVVVVCLPHDQHCEVTIDALSAGCHVLVEKPMAISVAQCNQMLMASREHGKTLAVAETASFTAGALLTGRKFASGLLGRYLSGCCINERYYFHDGRPAWFLDPSASGGGMFSNIGLHRLAVVRTCLPGLTPVAVSASVGHVPEHAIEACTTALVKYKESGAMTYEEVGYFPRPQWLNVGLHFIFEAGIVAWHDHTWRMMTRDGQEYEEQIIAEPMLYRPVYANLLAAIKGGDCKPSARDCAADVAIVHAAYASSQQGRQIDLMCEPWTISS